MRARDPARAPDFLCTAVVTADGHLALGRAGANAMMRYVGSIVGAGILGAVLSSDAGAPEIALFRAIFALLAATAALAVASGALIHRFPRGPNERPAAPAPEAIGEARRFEART